MKTFEEKFIEKIDNEIQKYLTELGQEPVGFQRVYPDNLEKCKEALGDGWLTDNYFHALKFASETYFNTEADG